MCYLFMLLFVVSMSLPLTTLEYFFHFTLLLLTLTVVIFGSNILVSKMWKIK